MTLCPNGKNALMLIEGYAAWNFMGQYFRHYHITDRSLTDCKKKGYRISCRNYNSMRDCPCCNGLSSGRPTNNRARKLPAQETSTKDADSSVVLSILNLDANE